MPSTQNITATADWVTPLPVPEDGARITADAAGGSDGPVNPGFQGLMDRDAAITDGIVTLLALTVDGTGQQPATPTPGVIEASGTIRSTGGNVSAQNNVSAVTGNVSAGTYVDAGTDLRAHQNGDSSLNGARLLWTSVGTGGTGGNPPRATALTNDLRPLNTCRAWGIFETAPVSPVDDGANFLAYAVSWNGGTSKTTVNVTLASNMASTLFAVDFRINLVAAGAPIDPQLVSFTRTGTNAFRLVVDTLDLTAANYEIVFFVFGRQ